MRLSRRIRRRDDSEGERVVAIEGTAVCPPSNLTNSPTRISNLRDSTGIALKGTGPCGWRRMRSDATPAATSASATLRARASERSRLSPTLPSGVARPRTTTGVPGRGRALVAAFATVARASGPIAALSSVKNTMEICSCILAPRSVGDWQAARAVSNGAANIDLRHGFLLG